MLMIKGVTSPCKKRVKNATSSRNQCDKSKICTNVKPSEPYQSKCVCLSGSGKSDSAYFKLMLKSYSTLIDLCFVYCRNYIGCFPAMVYSLLDTVFECFNRVSKDLTVAVTNVAGMISQ